MNSPLTPQDTQGSSTRPYLIRALHDWCTDNGFTPYLAVFVTTGVQVPMEYVKNNEIVLNVGFEATSGLKLGNEFIEFKARFGGVAREIVVPVDHVVAIYARENGQGMAFPMPSESTPTAASEGSPTSGSDDPRSPRGLRLASVEGQFADSEPATIPAMDAEGGDEEPPTPSQPGAGRPALKRVK